MLAGLCFADIVCKLMESLFIIPGIIKQYEYMMIPFFVGRESTDESKRSF